MSGSVDSRNSAGTTARIVVGFAIMALLLAFGWLLNADHAHAQAGVSMTVDPTTDLVDGQDVQVTVSGTLQGNEPMFIRQCVAGATDAGQCDRTVLGVAETGHGNGGPLSTTVVVYREIDIEAGTIDCAVDACVLTLSPYTDPSNLFAEVSIAFDPAVPAAPRPTATVTPNDDLMEGEIVVVEGAGFEPFERLWIAQCGPDNTRHCQGRGSDTAELDGTFRVELPLRRVIRDHGLTQVDCGVDACSLVIERRGRTLAPIALNFDADAPLEQALNVKVRPRKNLFDGDIVSVTVTPAEGELLSGYASVLQCALFESGVVDGEACHQLGNFQRNRNPDGEGPATTLPPATTDPPATPSPPTTAGPSGVEPLADDLAQLTGDVQVRQMLFFENHNGESRRIDCQQTKCAVVVLADADSVSRSQVLKFDAESVVPKAVVKITGRNKLSTDAPLTVNISKTRTRSVEVRQCPRSAMTHLDHRCQRIGSLYRGPRNQEMAPIGLEKFTVTARPVRFVGHGANQVDCREPKACDLRVFGSDGPMRRLLVNFTPESSPIAETFRLAKRKNIENREPIAIKVGRTGRGWSLVQCADRSSSVGCVQIRVNDAVEESGVTRGTVALRRIVNGVDCAVARCQLRLVSGHRETDRVALRFDPNTPGDPEPTFEAKPRRGLQDGQLIEITSRNTGGRYQVLQCVRDDDGLNTACLYLPQGRVSEPDDLPGTRQVSVAVRRTITGVDCAESAGRCQLVFQRNHSASNFGVVNLRFDPDGPETPEPAAKVRPRKGLADGQLVNVTLTAIEHPFVQQCVVLNGEVLEGSCQGINMAVTERTEDSTTGTVRVRRYIAPQGVETPYDCASQPRTCVLRVSSYGNHDGQPSNIDVSLVFNRRSEPVSTTQTLVVDDEGPIARNSLVNVSGAGFSPGLNVFVLSCPDIEEIDGNLCDTGTLTPVQVGPDGTFSVSATFSDCETERCRFGAGDAGGTEAAVSEPFDVDRG